MTDSMIKFDTRCQALLMCELRYNRKTKQWEGIYPWNEDVKLPVAILNSYQVSDQMFLAQALALRAIAIYYKPPSKYKYI